MPPSKRRRTEKSSPASTATGSRWERSAPAPRSARRSCGPACRSPRSRQAVAAATRRCASWGSGWPATACWSIPCGAHAMRMRSSSSRRSPTIGRRRRGCARPTCSSCRGSPTCDGAATRWCWNRRAPERCSGSAIRSLRARSPRCPRRNRSGGCARRKIFRGSSCSRCCWTAASCSRSMPATAACDRARATTTSSFGTFTICCSTRAARRAGTPTRWARLLLMRAS